jgi:hypothetical protein
MDTFKTLILNHWLLLLMAIILLVYIIYLVITHKIKEVLLGLMLQAERLCKAKILDSGQAQEDWVFDQLKAFFPKYVAILGETRIRAFIKYLFKKAKDLLDDGKLNNSTV